MKLVMGVSADGYLARYPGDNMGWLGRDDKLAFRLLTSVGAVCGASKLTCESMPELAGRKLLTIDREAFTLKNFNDQYPEGWLCGGPRIAEIAIKEGLVTEAHMCVSLRKAFIGDPGKEAYKDTLTPMLIASDLWELKLKTPVNGLSIVNSWYITGK